jgi:hypothetical protein
MLVIRPEQLQILAAAHERAVEQRLLVHLRDFLVRNGKPMCDAKLYAELERGLASGRRFFTSFNDLARYAEIVLLQLGGWGESDHPEKALKLLRGEAVSTRRRLDNFAYWTASREERKHEQWETRRLARQRRGAAVSTTSAALGGD